jgi:hypothetical protein
MNKEYGAMGAISMFVARLLNVGAVVLLGTGCWGRETQSPLVRETRLESGITLRVSLEKGEFVQLESITVDVELRNDSDEDIRVVRTGSLPQQFRLGVADRSTRTEVPLTRLGERMVNGAENAVRPLRLKPGEKRHARMILNLLFDLSVPSLGGYEVTCQTAYINAGATKEQTEAFFMDTSQGKQISVSGLRFRVTPLSDPAAP